MNLSINNRVSLLLKNEIRLPRNISINNRVYICVSPDFTGSTTMSLKPKRVDFGTTWATLKETIQGVITFSNVPRAVWNDRFTGSIQ